MPEIDFRKTPVTLVITAVAAALEIVCTLEPDMRNALLNTYRLGMLSSVWAGEWWRPVTTTLVHGDLFHAAFNIYWMFVFGPALENRYGPLRMLLLFVMLAMATSLPQFVISNYQVSDVSAQQGLVGLSGVIYGLFAVVWIGRRHEPELRLVCPDSAVMILWGWFFLCVAVTIVQRFAGETYLTVANFAHAFGLLFGTLYGLAIYDSHRRRFWLAASVAASILVLTLLFTAPPGHKLYQRHRQLSAVRAVGAVRSTDSLRKPHGARGCRARLAPGARATFQSRGERQTFQNVSLSLAAAPKYSPTARLTRSEETMV